MFVSTPITRLYSSQIENNNKFLTTAAASIYLSNLQQILAGFD